MSSKRAGLPSLNSASGSKKEALQPVKVQRYRAGQAPEGYVDPALESSSDEDDQDGNGRRRANEGGVSRKINMSIGDQNAQPERKTAYQIINVEKMAEERRREKAEQRQKGGDLPVPAGGGGDRRLARLQAIQLQDRRGRGDAKSRRRGGSESDEDQDEEDDNNEEDEEEAALRRRKAARARALREDAGGEEELWGQGEEEKEEDEDSKPSRSRRRGEVSAFYHVVYTDLVALRKI